jgi:hypothetical protein
LPEGQARSKIKEAEHFLHEMRDAEKALREDLFRYNLSAFLAAWRSVPDFVLYDYAEKNLLGISREDEERTLIANQFKIAANVVSRLEGNDEPSRFLQWWTKRCNAIYSEHRIVDKRNYTIHKGYPKVEKVADVENKAFVPTGSFSVSTSSPVYFIAVTSPSSYTSGASGSGTYTTSSVSTSGLYTTSGVSGSGLYTTSSVTLAPMTSSAPPDATETFRFHDQLDKDIVDICEDALDHMSKFVMESENSNWKDEK